MSELQWVTQAWYTGGYRRRIRPDAAGTLSSHCRRKRPILYLRFQRRKKQSIGRMGQKRWYGLHGSVLPVFLSFEAMVPCKVYLSLTTIYTRARSLWTIWQSFLALSVCTIQPFKSFLEAHSLHCRWRLGSLHDTLYLNTFKTGIQKAAPTGWSWLYLHWPRVIKGFPHNQWALSVPIGF